MSWTDSPFRQALYGLAQAQHVAVILDRRVDPDQKITLSLDSVPLEDAFARLAHQRQAGTTQLGAVIYIGPPSVAGRLRTLSALRVQEAQRLPADARRPLLAAQPLAWDDLATPRELLARLADEAGIRIEGQQQTPHDLWAGQSLPPMTWVDRLTLVAAQFDLTFRFDQAGRSVRLAPMPGEVALARTYPAGAKAAELVQRWRELAPEATIEVAAGGIVVRGLLEDHERIAGGTNSGATKSVAEKPTTKARRRGIEVHTLVARQVPLDKLLAELAKKLNLRVEWDQDALARGGISTTANVSVDVKDATLDELLTAALTPVGLSFRREGRVVTIEKR